ncbi:MAG: hypothetical protein R3D03_11005 [Geminicoccaceae bacterium]
MRPSSHRASETEIAVRLGDTIAAAGAPYDRHGIARHVEALMPAIEIVDDRYEQFRTAGAYIRCR